MNKGKLTLKRRLVTLDDLREHIRNTSVEKSREYGANLDKYSFEEPTEDDFYIYFLEDNEGNRKTLRKLSKEEAIKLAKELKAAIDPSIFAK